MNDALPKVSEVRKVSPDEVEVLTEGSRANESFDQGSKGFQSENPFGRMKVMKIQAGPGGFIFGLLLLPLILFFSMFLFLGSLLLFPFLKKKFRIQR